MNGKTIEKFRKRMRLLEKASLRDQKYAIELEGLKEVLSWLENFMERVDKEDVEGVFHSFVQMGVCAKLGCDCEYDVQEGSGGSPVSVWLHKNHTAYNRAVWEVIRSKPGMIEALRRETQKDLDGPSQMIERFEYGKVTSKRYARELLAFYLKDHPSRTWVGVVETA